MTSNYCTKLPCCDVVNLNHHNTTNCGSEQRNMDVYDDAFKTYVTRFEVCENYYERCFLENQRFRGQCCECNEGWGGKACDIPLCREPCRNGYCSDKDTCTCDFGFSGNLCELPICKKTCLNGVCLRVDYCECFYGWKGIDCSIPTKSPFCVNGVVIGVNNCKCAPGWKGDLCEIPSCPNCLKGICSEEGKCICDNKYISSDPDNFRICDKLISCDVLTENCSGCNELNMVCTECYKGYYLFKASDDNFICSKFIFIY